MLTRRTDVDFAVGESEHDAAAYTVDGDQLTYTAGGLSESYRVVQDPDGTLHLTAKPGGDPGDAFVNTVKPWTKVR